MHDRLLGLTRRLAPDETLDSVRSMRRALMLPNTKNGPPGGGQIGVVPAIPSDVAVKLRPPVVGVRLRRRAVFGATMPVATVNEDGYPCRREDDVRAATDAPYRRGVLPEAKTPAVKLRPERPFRRRVRPPVPAHHCARGSRGGGWRNRKRRHRQGRLFPDRRGGYPERQRRRFQRPRPKGITAVRRTAALPV